MRRRIRRWRFSQWAWWRPTAPLPLGTDTLMAIYIAERAAEEAGVLLIPPIWYGYTYVLDKFPGTISISQETLYRL